VVEKKVEKTPAAARAESKSAVKAAAKKDENIGDLLESARSAAEREAKRLDTPEDADSHRRMLLLSAVNTLEPLIEQFKLL
jgi:hypothetical protein